MEAVKKIELNRIIKIVIITILGTLLLTVSSKVKIPFYPVPMTMQTFVVLFLGLAFGYKVGLATVSLYLLEGIFGLPVFANSPEKGIGLVYFTGPTMGYLVGFLSACYLASYVNSKDSFMIGDKISDKQAAKKAKIKFFYKNEKNLNTQIKNILK